MSRTFFQWIKKICLCEIIWKLGENWIFMSFNISDWYSVGIFPFAGGDILQILKSTVINFPGFLVDE
jgi:hypothetical protein